MVLQLKPMRHCLEYADQDHGILGIIEAFLQDTHFRNTEAAMVNRTPKTDGLTASEDKRLLSRQCVKDQRLFL